MHMLVGGWRNWHTRRPQKPMAARPCRFNSSSAHYLFALRGWRRCVSPAQRRGTMRKPTLSFKILDPRRRAMLPKLAFLRREYGLYLAGGTALAMQIAHRTSVDFDFYSPRDFDPQRLYRALARRLSATTPTHVAEGTLMVAVQNVAMSFFRYDA